MVGIDRDHLRLVQVIELIELIRADLELVDQDAFLNSRLLIDATAYRLGSIGEYTGKLSPELKARHPAVEWRRAYDMRNALFHDYEGVIPLLLWEVLGQPLDKLATACRAELEARATPGSPAASP